MDKNATTDEKLNSIYKHVTAKPTIYDIATLLLLVCYILDIGRPFPWWYILIPFGFAIPIALFKVFARQVQWGKLGGIVLYRIGLFLRTGKLRSQKPPTY